MDEPKKFKKNLIVITTTETYSWLFVTEIFQSDDFKLV